MLRLIAVALLSLVMRPALAQAPLKYQCQDPTGFEVLATITITGTHYRVDTQMQVSGEGDFAVQEDGAGLVVLTGPLVTTFGLLGAKPASGPSLRFVDERGPVMVCRQQQD